MHRDREGEHGGGGTLEREEHRRGQSLRSEQHRGHVRPRSARAIMARFNPAIE